MNELAIQSPIPSARTTAPAPRAGAFVIALLVVLAAAGCRAQPRVVRPDQLSIEAVTLDLPLVEQDALHDCGLASISALCQYWSVEIPASQREAMARSAEENEGLSGRELCDALDRLGMEAFLFEGTLDRDATGLYRHLDQGRPPLVMISPEADRHHYCLVLGYDEPRGNLILLDPVEGQVLIPVAEFDREWVECRRFTLLACPKEGEGT